MRPERAPLAAVSLTFRDAPTALRVKASLPLEKTLVEGLRAHGVTGLVELHTCARSLWLASANNSAWVGALLQSSIASRLGGEVLPHVHVGEDAFRHALRVSVGLDSYVQGEADVGAQFSSSFAEAREGGRSDGVLNLLHQSAARLLAEGREHGYIRPNRGLGQLAVHTLRMRGADVGRSVGVVGAGAIGERVIASLRRAGWAEPVIYNRSPRPGTRPLTEIGDHEALVLCTAGPEGWFRPRAEHLHVIDLGLPPQVDGRCVGLDELLAGDELRLPSEKVGAAEVAVEREVGHLLARIRTSHWQRGLAGMQAVRDQFLEHDLEGILSDAVSHLNDEQQRKVLAATRGAFRQYSHRMLTWLKDELVAGEEAG